MQILANCMTNAFRLYFKDSANFMDCRLDPTLWGPDGDDQYHKSPLGDVKFYTTYIDPRGVADYHKFKRYFIPPADLDLLCSI